MSETMSVTEARTILGIGRRLAYRMVANGQLPSIRLGKCIRISRVALDKMLQGG